MTRKPKELGPPVQYTNPNTAAYRRTLDELPDRIALKIGLRVFEPMEYDTCVCGWVLREVLGEELGLGDAAPSATLARSITKQLNEHFPSDDLGWTDIYHDITVSYFLPLIEEALFDRVMAAATGDHRWELKVSEAPKDLLNVAAYEKL